LISDAYRDLLRQCHQDPSWGTSADAWVDRVRELVRQYGPTILDYGCGKGVLREHIYNVTNYDPATFPERPAAHDLVVCIDVLEHIEFEHLPAVLDDLRQLAKNAVFVVISTVPALKSLPDGRNAHLIVEHGDWWRDQLLQGFDLVSWQEGDVDLVAVLLPKVGE
jgi:cyclopropane fatty-acyl-phospholipid synthase-like methyltransferase